MGVNIRKRKKHKILNNWYIIIVFVIILLFVSASYSLWSEELYINWNISGEYVPPNLPIENPNTGNDYPIEASFGRTPIFNTELYRLQSNVYDSIENTITTTIKQVNQSGIYFLGSSTEISITINNNTDTMFSKGKIELLQDESNDSSGIANISNVTVTENISSGSSGTINISATLSSTEQVPDNTHLNYLITYELDGITHYLYYNIIIVP